MYINNFFKIKSHLVRLVVLSLQITIVLIAYFILHYCYFHFSYLPIHYYFKPILFLGILKENYLFLFLINSPLAFIYWRYRTITWKIFENGKPVKTFIFSVTLILAYAFSTYDYNLFYNQSHYLDRSLLILLSFLTLYSPIFIPLFLVVLIVIEFQFSYPFGGYSLTDKRILIDILILFCVFLYLSIIRRLDLKNFIFIALCLHGINYFTAGVGKLKIGWIFNEKIYNLVASSYINGWLAFIEQKHIMNLINIIKILNIPILIGTLITELSPLLMFSHRLAPFIILFGLILFHVGVFLASGIFFWKWILLNIAFLIVLKSFDTRVYKDFFNKYFIFLSIFLILLSPIFFEKVTIKPIQSARPIELAWYDTKLNVLFEIEAIGFSGNIYPVGRSFMSPYDFIFVQNRFHYLKDEKLLVRTYGQTGNFDIAKEIDAIELTEIGKGLLKKLENKKGKNYYNQARAEQFDYFIKTYFSNLNKRMNKKLFINNFAAPHHQWSFVRSSNAYQMQEKVKKINIRFFKTFFDGRNIYTLNNEIIRVIDIRE